MGIEVPVDAGLVVEADVEAPLVEAEVGGSAGVSSGGLCNLICAIVFLIFFLGDVSAFVYYLCVPGSTAFIVNGSPSQGRTLTFWVFGGAMALWLLLSLLCCCCYKKNKGSQGPTTVTYVDSYEVGGGAGVELEVAVEAPVVEVELEAPEVEVEVEIEAPEVEVEVEIEAPEVEVEVEVDAEVEVEVE